MKHIYEVCCRRCTHTSQTPCKNYIPCRQEGPFCHEDPACKEQRLSFRRRFSQPSHPVILVGTGTCGLAAGAEKIYGFFQQRIATEELRVELKRVGCFGLCDQEVMVDVQMPGGPRLSFGNVNLERAGQIWEGLIKADRIPKDFLLGVSPAVTWDQEVAATALEPLPQLVDLPVMRKQQRIVLENCGVIDPESLDEYILRDGLAGLHRVLTTLTPEETIEEILRSGLRGRGGGGFPTGKKWLFTRKAPGTRKYLICNADEGDPGAFMDRSVLEGDPYKVLEGMLIGGYAIGAQVAYVYARAEYPLAIKRLERAIDTLRQVGLLGERILGSEFSFDIRIKVGAGAFVCGEETALIASIEGKRGMPRPRPPYPAQSGLWGCPTNINNVETFANVPSILRKGGQWYSEIGTKGSPGTKVFALTGKTVNSGLIEVPMGITLREIIFDTGGGIANGKKFKAAQIGGPSGGCLPTELLDTPIDYDSLQQAGAMMGSGGLVVMDEETCMVDVARFFLNFTRKESCGKCIPCREGTARLLEILERMTSSKGDDGQRYQYISQAERLAHVVKDTSACGLGQTAPNPILSTLRYFRDEYEAHVYDQTCPSKQCKSLLKYSINGELCKGCTACVKRCPQGAIVGQRKHAHFIVEDKCIQCGVCEQFCPFDAIVVR